MIPQPKRCRFPNPLSRDDCLDQHDGGNWNCDDLESPRALRFRDSLRASGDPSGSPSSACVVRVRGARSPFQSAEGVAWPTARNAPGGQPAVGARWRHRARGAIARRTRVVRRRLAERSEARLVGACLPRCDPQVVAPKRARAEHRSVARSAGGWGGARLTPGGADHGVAPGSTRHTPGGLKGAARSRAVQSSQRPLSSRGRCGEREDMSLSDRERAGAFGASFSTVRSRNPGEIPSERAKSFETPFPTTSPLHPPSPNHTRHTETFHTQPTAESSTATEPGRETQ